MKVVINNCYGGFSLSARAIAELAKLQGRECFFFKSTTDFKNRTWIPIQESEATSFFTAFDIPNPNEVSDADSHLLSIYDIKHDDPLLIQVVETLGAEASGSCANLKIVEIPDNIEWEIEEYDGNEWVSEQHGTWS